MQIKADQLGRHLSQHMQRLYVLHGEEPLLMQEAADAIRAAARAQGFGERSSHTWFVLTYLLGYPGVRNYDGSWTEWGNLVGAPIEK